MKYIDRLKAWDSDYGRSEGWNIELDGNVIATMTERRFEDMFWESYRVTPTTGDLELAREITSEAFWVSDKWTNLTFRSRATALVATNAFPAGRPFVGESRVNMRGLLIRQWPPSRSEALLLKVWRFLGRPSMS